MSDLQSMTEDDLRDQIAEARAELRRRTKEEKMPVFAVNGVYYKSLKRALEELAKDVQNALNFKGGHPEKFLGPYLTDGVDKTRFGMRIEFWSKSEYDNRPDMVWGAPYE